MTTPEIRVSSDWLALREPADAAARARDLVARLREELAEVDRWVIHDLGCGTGSMGRWLAPLLPGPQHWILHDRDPDLLARAAERAPGPASDRTAVTVEARRSDITRLRQADLAGATLITASALLDVLSESELTRLLDVCASSGCALLLSLSVAGGVALTPPDPLDRSVAAAFDAHQRRATERGRLVGPDAVARAIEQLRRLGFEVLVRPSPWQLGPGEAKLALEWFTGWVGAACEQQVELAGEAAGYASRRLEQAAAGQLLVTVEHADLLALPRRDPVAAGSPG